MRVLLHQRFGARPYLAHVRAELFDFLGPSRRVAFVTAASLVDAVVVGGGNASALLRCLRQSGLLEPLRARVREGLPYAGASAGSNVAGPNILTTNDWNVVGLTAFEALGLAPFNVNPPYPETDPAMTPGSESRDMRIAEYHVMRGNPVLGIEEIALVRLEGGTAEVRGAGRAKLFRRGQAPAWVPAGARLLL